MKGDKGVCSTGKTKEDINRTKYDSEQHALDALNGHKEMFTCKDNEIVYQCKFCKTWHFGKPEYKHRFGI